MMYKKIFVTLFFLVLFFSVNLSLYAQEPVKGKEGAFIPPPPPVSKTNDTTPLPNSGEQTVFMAGSVAVGIVLVESNGQADISSEDWTTEEKQQVFNEIIVGLNWWAELEPRANLSFVYNDHFSNPVATDVEPITRPYTDQQYWITDAMDALGYHDSSYFTQVRNYNSDLRAIYQTDWAFTIFVVDSSADTDGSFADGYSAYAFLGGPFLVMTYDNDGYGPGNMDAVTAHEVGHIFYALDQYFDAQQPCTKKSGYLDVENQNSQQLGCLTNAPSIMKFTMGAFPANQLDMYGAGQVGWQDSDLDAFPDVVDGPVSVNYTLTEPTTNISGTIELKPWDSVKRDILINKIVKLEYTTNGDNWIQLPCADESCDSYQENFQFHYMLDTLLWLRVSDQFGREEIKKIYGEKIEYKIFLPIVNK